MSKKQDWETVRLDKILDKADMKQVLKFAKQGDMRAIKEYLRGIEDKLKEKNILPDYLYYCLENEFRRRKII